MTPFRRWLSGAPIACVEFPSTRSIDLDHRHDLLAYTALTAFFAPDNG
jgi:hypothetical protein